MGERVKDLSKSINCFFLAPICMCENIGYFKLYIIDDNEYYRLGFRYLNHYWSVPYAVMHIDKTLSEFYSHENSRFYCRRYDAVCI